MASLFNRPVPCAPSAPASAWSPMKTSRTHGRVLVTALAVMVVASSLAMLLGRGAVDDLQLGGRIYLADGTFLGATGCADLTPFSVYFTDTGGTPHLPPYVSPVGTSGGWYSIHISSVDKNISWGDGWTYTVEVDASACGPAKQNYTSYGSGSFYDANANGTQDPGEPNEYSGYGNLTNEVMWYPTDGWQLWDIQAPAPDLLPINLLFDTQPGNRVVALSSSHTVTFSVTNQGTTMVNLTSTSTAYNGSTPLSPFGTFPTIPLAPSQSVPFSVNWNAPSVPGTDDLCVEADWRTGAIGPGGEVIRETNELNNVVCITVSVARPDLAPQPVTVRVNGVAVIGSPFNWQSTCLVVPLQLTDTVSIDAVASEVAGYAAPSVFTVQMYETIACGGQRSGGYFFTSPALGPLAAFGQTAVQTSAWTNPGSPGTHFVNVTVDSWFGGNVTEGNEANNSFMIQFVVGGPDLVCGPISVDGTPVTFPQGGPVLLTIAQVANILAAATNAGGATADTFSNEIWTSDSTGAIRFSRLATQSLVGGLGAGATGPAMNPTDPWSIPGNYYITFYTDINNNVVETTDLNNDCTVWFQVQGPDLTPSNVLIDGVLPPPIKALSIGAPTTISTQVRNVGGNSTGSPFTVTFWNTTANCALRDPFPFLTMTFATLGPGAVSPETASSPWSSPSSGDFWVQIYVDSDIDVVEVDEGNNTFCQHIIVGGLPDLAVTAFTINGNAAASNATLDVIVGQVVRLGAGVTNLGVASSFLCAPSFDLVWYQVSPPLEVRRLAQGSINPGQSRAANVTAFPASLTPGTYEIRIIADYTAGDNPEAPTGIVCELDDGLAANNNVYRLTLTVVQPPPPPDVLLTATPNSVTLDWTSVAGATNYLLYRGPSPATIDFSTPITTVAAPTTTYTDNAALTTVDEAYYVIRSAESHGWRGASSDVVGAVRRTFPAGYTTFSLPLKPFASAPTAVSDWAKLLLVSSRDSIYTWSAAGGAWLGHAKTMPVALQNFTIDFGVGYDIFHAATMQYTFVGYPATTISYYDGDNADPRIGNDAGFRDGLAVAVSGGQVQLSWAAAAAVSADEVLGEYGIYRTAVRGDFDLTSPLATVSAANTTWSEPVTSCAVSVCEAYYLVLAWNTNGRRGGSTFAVAVITQTFVIGYQYLGLRLDPGTLTAVGLLTALPAAAQPGAVVFETVDATQSLVGHAFGMPAGTSPITILRGRGHTLYLRVAGAIVWIGR